MFMGVYMPTLLLLFPGVNVDKMIFYDLFKIICPHAHIDKIILLG